ncbi:unnamed protein product [Acanthosepion pharaonis]|uniref:Uncharacterized protein n=1 Tax=Acanthosepion pharaonis TaxID=158019 RepID=A0A812CCV9_ACAPH|nr:unnamed protein product [Sepia pharaonis]
MASWSVNPSSSFPHHSIPLFIYLSPFFLILFLLILPFIFTHILPSFHLSPFFPLIFFLYSLTSPFHFLLLLPYFRSYPPLHLYPHSPFISPSFSPSHNSFSALLSSTFSILLILSLSTLIPAFVFTLLILHCISFPLSHFPLPTLNLPFIFTLIFFLSFISSPTHCVPLFTYPFLSYIISAVSTQISLSILSLPFLLNPRPSLFSLSPFFHPLSDPFGESHHIESFIRSFMFSCHFEIISLHLNRFL